MRAATHYDHSLDTYYFVSEQFQKYTSANGTDEAAERAVRDSVPQGLYEHWKSTERSLKYYIVLAAGLEQDVHTPLVTYTALYKPHAGKWTHRNLLRKDRGFLSPIDRDSYKGPRFRFIAALTLHDIATLLEYIDELSGISDSVDFLQHVGALTKKKIPLF
jgi:hypothetical protein